MLNKIKASVLAVLLVISAVALTGCESDLVNSKQAAEDVLNAGSNGNN